MANNTQAVRNTRVASIRRSPDRQGAGHLRAERQRGSPGSRTNSRIAGSTAGPRFGS